MSDSDRGVDAMRRKTDAGCPKDCPRRCAVPNCHNVETCEIWARYVADLEARKAAIAKAKAAEKDVNEVAAAFHQRCEREAKRHKCRN